MSINDQYILLNFIHEERGIHGLYGFIYKPKVSSVEWYFIYILVLLKAVSINRGIWKARITISYLLNSENFPSEARIY